MTSRFEQQIEHVVRIHFASGEVMSCTLLSYMLRQIDDGEAWFSVPVDHRIRKIRVSSIEYIDFHTPMTEGEDNKCLVE